ncbi:MAG TPA: GntR family transcriptional regulator [Symbiobacteriaceae bacterium]
MQIADEIREAIKRSMFRPNQQLPPENMLAAAFQVSRTTIRSALDMLAEEGLIYKVRGLGTFVAEPRPEGELHRLRGFYEDMTAAGYTVTTELLTAEETVPDAAIAEALRLESGATIYLTERRRFANGEPVVVSREHIPASLCPELLHDMKSGRVESLYAYLERKGLRVRRAVLQFSAVAATGRISELLDMSQGTPVLLEKRLSMTIDNKPICWGFSYFRGDRYAPAVEMER